MLPRTGHKGLSLFNGLLIGLLVLVMTLGGMALYRANNTQTQVTRSFEGWYEDHAGYQQALTDQKASHKPILLYFYATWCPHCKDFAADVLAQPEMQAFVKAYPHVRIAPDNGQPEQQLMSEFEAPGFPTFYVVLPNQKRVQIDTFTQTPPQRAKTAAEFIQSIEEVTGQK